MRGALDIEKGCSVEMMGAPEEEPNDEVLGAAQDLLVKGAEC